VVKLARDFDIPTTTLTTILKNKDKIVSEYEAKHRSVNGNADQRTLLTLSIL